MPFDDLKLINYLFNNSYNPPPDVSHQIFLKYSLKNRHELAWSHILATSFFSLFALVSDWPKVANAAEGSLNNVLNSIKKLFLKRTIFFPRINCSVELIYM